MENKEEQPKEKSTIEIIESLKDTRLILMPI
jgi:hypothetical protein